MSQPEELQETRKNSGRRSNDRFIVKIRTITGYLSIIITLIAFADLLVRGIDGVISVSDKAAQLGTIINQFQPTVTELKDEVATNRIQDSSAIALIRTSEIHDSAQLVELKRAVKALNNVARAINAKQ